MSFLQPWLLAGLPLISLPLIIHLINQRRYQSLRWAAMMFLLAASRMSRGYAKLRQWLIMAARMAAIAALVFAVSRPLASGWLGLAGAGRADTTLILLDRSPSMQQTGDGGQGSKLDTGRRQLAQALQTLSSARWVLIESTANQPRELESPESLLTLPATEPASASADLPAMLQAAHDYLRANRAGRTEIWICSDLREHDWQATSGRWQTLRDAFREFTAGVRFHLLAYPQRAAGNVAVRVADVRRRQVGDSAELLVSLRLTRDGNADEKLKLPVEFEIEGARSVVEVELEGPQFDLKDHRIPWEGGRRARVGSDTQPTSGDDRGWGRVSIPADANPADNDFYFVFDVPVPRTTLIVADDPQTARLLQLAASSSPDSSVQCQAQIVARDQLASVTWDQVALCLWQAPLPEDDTAAALHAFVDRGGQVIFLPPPGGGAGNTGRDPACWGLRWQEWVDARQEVPVETWRSDQDLLAHTLSGAALPVGQLQIRRYCGLSGEFTPLATLKGGAPLFVRVTTNRGGVYACTTTATPGDSSLGTSGVVLYVFVQRALAAGAAVLGNSRQMVAGAPPAELATSWQRVAGPDEGFSTEYSFHRGVYAVGEKQLAVNRAEAEDQARVVAEATVAELFRGLDFVRVDEQAGSVAALIQEIWRLFLLSMLVALVAEAALCLPKLARPKGATA